MTVQTATQLKARLGAVDPVEWQRDMADSARLRADYKEYVCLLSQDGTADPVATVLKNTLAGTPVWTRNDIGDYLLTLSGAFPVAKTFVIIGGVPDPATVYSFQVGNGNFIAFKSQYSEESFPPTQDDTLFSDTPIEIRVYP